ncbi:MAG: GNAT family N-acetyltransferase [Chroococcales cyanobacterium]
MINIINLSDNQETLIEPLSELLLEGFRENWPEAEAWPTIDAARKEVLDSLAEDRINRVALNEAGEVLGWVGGISQYHGHVWEVHPLVVAANYRRQGIGRTLLKDLEQQVRNQGGLTLWLGTDDETNMTSLSGVNLYSNLWEKFGIFKICEIIPINFIKSVGLKSSASCPMPMVEGNRIFIWQNLWVYKESPQVSMMRTGKAIALVVASS